MFFSRLPVIVSGPLLFLYDCTGVSSVNVPKATDYNMSQAKIQQQIPQSSELTTKGGRASEPKTCAKDATSIQPNQLSQPSEKSEPDPCNNYC